MIVTYCNQFKTEENAAKKCAESVKSITNENIVGRSHSLTDAVKYIPAKIVQGAPALRLEIDHDETTCSGKEACVYTIFILGAD